MSGAIAVMASEQDRRTRICNVLSQVGALHHVPSPTRNETRENAIKLNKAPTASSTTSMEDESTMSRREVDVINARTASARRKASIKQKGMQAQRAVMAKQELQRLLDCNNSREPTPRPRRSSSAHAQQLWFTLKKMFIQTAVFNSMLPVEERDSPKAVQSQKAAQTSIVQSSFAGTDKRDMRAKKALGKYQDYLSTSLTPRKSPHEETKTKESHLSVQTRKGISQMQKSLEHRDISKVDTEADKLCALTIADPLFDFGVTSQPKRRRRQSVCVKGQVSEVTNYWASLVQRSDPHRLQTKDQVKQHRRVDAPILKRVRRMSISLQNTQLPQLTGSRPDRQKSRSAKGRRHSFAVAGSDQFRRFTLPVGRGEALPKLRGGQRMSFNGGISGLTRMTSMAEINEAS